MQTHPIQWYITAPQPCPYLQGREMQTVLVDPAARLRSDHYGRLLGEGFRRSGQFVYRHQCPSCRACIPVRIPVTKFRPGRAQRRCLHRNADLDVRHVRRPDLDEHMTLFRRYLDARHPGGGMESTTRDDYAGMLSERACGVLLFEHRLGSELLAVAVTDVTPRGLSAMYSFFDPNRPERSLGTYAILRQIDEARRMGLPHLYLGYWIPGSEKMDYKTRFRPVEGRANGAWRRIGTQ
ncbi:Arginine-tRNA-protein transferase [Thioalkalivibrio nitratireducens DSM 14787]|uniref:Aspartate/glutamate leucyltransferase n=1 Tax=Thioalkalivibrio nitratireducens (strain DSM 14787 / UNIQEM 213 / ALEN2) TaxID=1255043 RepID=L0DSH2_THIND|nr:arginyltransferase [Thioalkalivibrio nitratireducens]AGA31948.1 Arginine-tRNA-protein transferase [Thioalkalivibrio nitratireducens DSM 14787]